MASNTANTDTSIDLCMRSMLVQVKRPRRCTDLERVVRRHLAQLAAISDSAFLDHANLRILARTLVADKGSSGWWNADAPSFSLAALRIGVTEVERRALGIATAKSTTEFLPYVVLPSAFPSQVFEAVAATLASHNTHEPQLPAPGRNWVWEHRLKPCKATRWLSERTQTGTVQAPTGSGKSTAARAFLHAALAHAYRNARQVRHRARSVTGIDYRVSSTRRDRQLDATRQARTKLRHNMLRRCAGSSCPGQIVTASPRVSRGPNSAREQPTRIRLWGAPTH
ncbi:hypothetical protein [Nocardia fluminea]|uniref:hypothetical protein n=1 Tax=Nocardia fluminea TaxID=134984 RepID=UPI0033C44260